MATDTADSWTIHVKLNNPFKHQLHLIFSTIRKILIKCEDTLNTDQVNNIHMDKF